MIFIKHGTLDCRFIAVVILTSLDHLSEGDVRNNYSPHSAMLNEDYLRAWFI